MLLRTLSAVSLLWAAAPLLPAQIFPLNPPAQTSVLLPFNAPTIRFQQWYSAADFTAQMVPPSRIASVIFLAGNSSTVTTMLDVQVRMAHAPAFPTGLFDSNFATPAVVVLPRQMVPLTATGPGSPTIIFNFDNPFPYDGVSPVVIDIQIFGNQAGPSGSSGSFTDEYLASNLAIGQTSRLYNTSSANATSSTSFEQGIGLITIMTFLPGSAQPFGQGCPGEGNIVPEHTVQLFPRPGLPFTAELRNAPPQRSALLIAGFSNTTWAGLNLPLGLGSVGADGTPGGGLGIGGAGCNLLVSFDLPFAATTTGFGPGGGIASVTETIPPLSGIVGASLFTQWVVIDPLAPNGTLCVSNAVQSIGGNP